MSRQDLVKRDGPWPRQVQSTQSAQGVVLTLLHIKGHESEVWTCVCRYAGNEERFFPPLSSLDVYVVDIRSVSSHYVC